MIATSVGGTPRKLMHIGCSYRLKAIRVPGALGLPEGPSNLTFTSFGP